MTLSPTDDGADQEEALACATTLVVAVQDSLAFSHTVASTRPVDATAAKTDAEELAVAEDTDRFHIDA